MARSKEGNVKTDAQPKISAIDLGFPRDFLWGASTSSFQIEGGAADGGRAPSIWDTRCRVKDGIAHGHTGDVACDHYHRYAEDVRLMRDLGLSAYRFSVAWPRLLPRGRGAVNEAGVDFYDRLIDTLLEAGIEPWLCLYHWDLPQALDDLGGWTNRDSAGWFADYTALCAKRFGDRVKRWATFNEFSVFTLFGYCFGWGAPGVADRDLHLRAIHHVNLAHGAGVDVLRDLVPGASIGAIHSYQPCHPATDLVTDREATAVFNEHWNLAFPDPQLKGAYPSRLARAIEPYVQAGDMARICRPLDWFGLNHYAPMYCRAEASNIWGFGWGETPAELGRTGVGWPIKPDDFRDTLIELSRKYCLPIYVTENGYGTDADKSDRESEIDDQVRVAYLRDYVTAMANARKAGADVRGYFVWSLLDNFEWGAGYANRFGIVYVDFETQERIWKSSAKWYKALIGGC